MTIPPFDARSETTRPHFRGFAPTCATNWHQAYPHQQIGRQLSMGMSHDFEIAIEEGATLVRVGSAIFGAAPETVSQ